MALEMRTNCERCEADLLPGGTAYICSFECTYCENCADHLMHICPECEGELVRRPKRSAGSQSSHAH